MMRARAEVQTTTRDREQIIVTEIPYQVNKAQLLERIGELVREKTIEGISDIRDESDRKGMRIVIEIKRDGAGDVVLNQLYRHTRLQTSFAVNMLAMNNGRPEQMGLRDVLNAFCLFRQEVVTRRTRFLLDRARNRAHILAGLLVALASIDEIIEIKTLISHPMHSGRAVDGDGNLVPRQIINSFRVYFNSAEIMSVDLKPSVSANPFFTFPFKVTEPGTFEFVWVEDGGAEYKKSKTISIV